MFQDGDTIVALATPPGRGALAIVRASGADAWTLAAAVFCAKQPPQPRLARVGELVHPGTGEVVDQAVLVLYRSPYSYTGEDMAEFTVHAGPAVVEAALAACYAAGARPAEPGEFTWRAMLQDKVDLTEAQAIADLAEARTAAARADALRRLAGELSREVTACRDAIVRARAVVEGALEFGEDVDAAEVEILCATAEDAVRRLLAHSREREALLAGLTVAIAGPPNAGKSTLFNRLLGEDRAIVAPSPGTTRDRLEAPLVLGGVLFRLSDGAGLHDEPAGDVEEEGIRRARAHVEEAALVIWVFDGSVPYAGERPPVPPARLVPVVNKCDLALAPGWEGVIKSRRALGLSARTGEGVDQVVRLLTYRGRGTAAEEKRLSLSARERRLLDEAAAHLARARAQLAVAGVDELAAEELKLAAEALGKVVGAIPIDELYDEVFSRFCVGK